MTEQEAMEIIMQVAYDGEFPLNSNEAFGIACKCMQKQIPKKPIIIRNLITMMILMCVHVVKNIGIWNTELLQPMNIIIVLIVDKH